MKRTAVLGLGSKSLRAVLVANSSKTNSDPLRMLRNRDLSVKILNQLLLCRIWGNWDHCVGLPGGS